MTVRRGQSRSGPGLSNLITPCFTEFYFTPLLTNYSLLFIIFLIMLHYSLLFSGETYYPIHNHLGSVRVVVDKNANVV
jgi:hypothetical protein